MCAVLIDGQIAIDGQTQIHSFHDHLNTHAFLIANVKSFYSISMIQNAGYIAPHLLHKLRHL